MKLEMTRPTLVDMKGTKPGDIIETDIPTANMLVASGKARFIIQDPEMEKEIEANSPFLNDANRMIDPGNIRKRGRRKGV
jgi:hypothetical protein